MKKVIVIDDNGNETEYTDFVLIAQEQEEDVISTVIQSSELTTFYANGYLNAWCNNRVASHLEKNREEENNG